MFLSEIGKIAEKCWNEIPIHYPCVQLDKYVIMPNHIHGVIKIIDGDDNIAGGENVGAEDFQPLRPHMQKNTNVGVENLQPLPRTRPQPNINQYQKVIPRSLGSIIRGFKIGVTKYCDQRKFKHFAFQRSYHEHIVRNENELNRIREYIMYNPLRWQFDRENRDNINVGVGLKPTPTADDNKWDDLEEAIFGKK